MVITNQDWSIVMADKVVYRDKNGVCLRDILRLAGMTYYAGIHG